MEFNQEASQFFCDDLSTNRKKLFEEALKYARCGKVLFITCEELEELPQLSQNLDSINIQYMKMISFMYAKTLDSLLESLSTLPDWKVVPSAIILDDISRYCEKSNLHGACGLVAFIVDSARSCAKLLKGPCIICVSACKQTVGDEYCNTLKSLYFEH